MVTKKLTKVQQQNIIFRLYALLMSQYCILEGRKAKAILPTDNPMSDFCVIVFPLDCSGDMYAAEPIRSKGLVILLSSAV